MGSFGRVGGGGYFFKEELQFKNQPDTCFALFKEKRMKFKNGIAIAKNVSPVQNNFKIEITEKLVTLF